MPWKKDTAENLKKLIREGNFQEFQTTFDEIRKSHSKETINHYLNGKVDARGLLWWAANANKSEKFIKYLVKAGAIIDQADGDGETPLWRAVSNGHIQNAQALKKYGADINIQIKGQTLLHVAARGESEEMIKWLITLGIKVEAIDQDGITPLHTAAEYSIRPVHALVKYGHEKINLDAQDNEGNTPLHYAAENSVENVIKYLLLLNADSTIHNKENKTAYEVADKYTTGDSAERIIENFNFAEISAEAAEKYYVKCMVELGSFHE